MKLSIAECTLLLEALNGPSVVNQKAADLYERVRAERERLRSARKAETYTRIWSRSK